MASSSIRPPPRPRHSGRTAMPSDSTPGTGLSIPAWPTTRPSSSSTHEVPGLSSSSFAANRRARSSTSTGGSVASVPSSATTAMISAKVRVSAGVAVRTRTAEACQSAAPMERLPTQLAGPVLLAPTVHGDERGFFLETYRRDLYRELGIEDEFVQDNHSRSRQGIVRGMHFQPGQAKLVRCVRGAIVDVICDIRPGSPQFGQWEAFELSDANAHQLYVPDGFGHGFCVTSEVADVVYKVSTYYDPGAESGFRFDDPEVGIEWPLAEMTPSQRDREAPLLSEIRDSLPFN